uniref:Putative secreted protein ovary overexpressed n=1 Tax=Rhipicephalus microplus TaxID=6941 RepID=A0A6M2DAK1_RHIMP
MLWTWWRTLLNISFYFFCQIHAFCARATIGILQLPCQRPQIKRTIFSCLRIFLHHFDLVVLSNCCFRQQAFYCHFFILYDHISE